MISGPRTVRNLLLAGLSAEKFDLLANRFQLVDLQLRDPIQAPGEKIRHVYFFETALASIISRAGEEEVEVAICGRDGMSGVSVLHDTDVAPYQCFIQVSGDAYRIDADELRQLVREHEELERRFIRFSEFNTIQIAHTALANARFTVLGFVDKG